MFVKFKDETENEVVELFGCAQDPELHPDVVELDADDQRLHSFLLKHGVELPQ